MAALEVLDYLLAIGFIIAIIVDRGQQAIQLESFEILLVLSILLHAAGITIVRVAYYFLSLLFPLSAQTMLNASFDDATDGTVHFIQRIKDIGERVVPRFQFFDDERSRE